MFIQPPPFLFAAVAFASKIIRYGPRMCLKKSTLFFPRSVLSELVAFSSVLSFSFLRLTGSDSHPLEPVEDS